MLLTRCCYQFVNTLISNPVNNVYAGTADALIYFKHSPRSAQETGATLTVNARVKEVRPGSQADTAGVRVGWRIIEVNEVKVTQHSDVIRELTALRRLAGKGSKCAAEARLVTSSRGLSLSGTKRYKKGQRPTKKMWNLDAVYPLGLTMVGCRIDHVQARGQAADAKIKSGYKILAIVSQWQCEN